MLFILLILKYFSSSSEFGKSFLSKAFFKSTIASSIVFVVLKFKTLLIFSEEMWYDLLSLVGDTSNVTSSPTIFLLISMDKTD